MPGDGVPPGQYLGVTSFSLYPFSSGHIHITGPDLQDLLDFDTGFLTDPEDLDVKTHVWAYKKQREIMRRMECYRGEVPTWHPNFAKESHAALIDTDAPLPEGVDDIKYSAEDDKVIEEFVRQKVATTWHSMGTCKMKPPQEEGAVDAALSVYGVEGLKVADLSITPSNVGANTNNTALVIGERAADVFIRELGLAP
jgi:choline dehydrogenase-like flavoprotein